MIGELSVTGVNSILAMLGLFAKQICSCLLPIRVECDLIVADNQHPRA